MPRLVAARQDLLREIETLRKQITDISKESITLSSEVKFIISNIKSSRFLLKQVSSIENAAGQAIGQSARLSLEVEAKRNEINASSAELDVLRAILNSLREEHASAMKNLNDLRSKVIVYMNPNLHFVII
jgi:chromosome segregation ATPase